MISKAEPAYNCLTLTFRNRELEAAYRDDYFLKRVPQLRLDLILGTLLYLVFGIHDYWVIPDIKEFAWTVRYLVVCPLLSGLFLFS